MCKLHGHTCQHCTMWLTLLCEFTYCCLFNLHAHAQDEEDDKDPIVVDAVSDAVRRHPNLIEVTVGRDCSLCLTSGVVKGVLQKANVHTR